MTNQTNSFNTPHTLHSFNSELTHLDFLVLEMAELVMSQLEEVKLAFEHGEIKLAQVILSKCEQVNQYQIKIDNKVLEVIALQAPVANDLRTIITTSKIAVELQNMSDEIYCFARLISAFFYPEAIDPYSKRLGEIVKISDMLKHILTKLFHAYEHRDSNQAWKVRQNSTECGIKLQEGIKRQLAFMEQNPRLIGKSLDIMQMIKALERCSDHSRNLREYMIFMFDGINIRHAVIRA